MLGYITHFASDSASIFQQFMGMTVPKYRGMKFHIHITYAADLRHLTGLYRNHESDCDSFARQFLVLPFLLGVVLICYVTLGGRLEK